MPTCHSFSLQVIPYSQVFQLQNVSQPNTNSVLSSLSTLTTISHVHVESQLIIYAQTAADTTNQFCDSANPMSTELISSHNHPNDIGNTLNPHKMVERL